MTWNDIDVREQGGLSKQPRAVKYKSQIAYETGAMATVDVIRGYWNTISNNFLFIDPPRTCPDIIKTGIHLQVNGNPEKKET